MARITQLVTALCLFSLLSRPVVADDLANSFDDAVARAEAQEHAALTRGYFTKFLLPYYGRKYAHVLQSCFATVPKPDSSRFSFVAAIGEDGRVLRVYRDQETNIFQCMRESLQNETFPRPPVFPYYLHIQMNFSDDGATGGDSKETAAPLVMEPNKYSYTFGVPKGWEYDFDEQQEYGIRLTLFPKGESFQQSASIIYVTEVNAVCKTSCAGMGSKAIAKTIQEAKDGSPTLQVAIEQPITIKEGGAAQVRLLTGARDPRQAKEALAFIEHNETIVLAVLTTRDTKTWDQDYRVFQEVVSGHKFFTCSSPNLATPCHQ
jgi:hypothetical protein